MNLRVSMLLTRVLHITGNTQAPKVTYPFPAYIVDHFSVAGVEAGVKYWTENLLSDELLPLLAQ